MVKSMKTANYEVSRFKLALRSQHRDLYKLRLSLKQEKAKRRRSDQIQFAKLQKATAKNDKLRRKNDKLQGKNDKLQRQNDKLQLKILNLQKAIEKVDKLLDKHQHKIDKLQRKIDKLQRKNTWKQDRIDYFIVKLAQARLKLNECNVKGGRRGNETQTHSA